MFKCKLCSSNEVSQIDSISSSYFNGIDYSLYLCNSCDCKFFNPKEHPVDLQDMFDQLDSDNQIFEVKFSRSRYWDFHKDFIIKQYDGDIKKVLDVGCRTGDFLMHFDKKTHKEGVELSSIAANIANQRGIVIHNDYVENIHFSSKFDVITSFAVLEHLPDPNVFMKVLQSWVNENGLLVLMMPSHECLKEYLASRFNHPWRMYTPPSHINFYSRKWLDETLLKEGFVLEKRYFTSGGAFNPFRKIPLLGRVFQILMYTLDRTPLNQIPVFDHQYSIYRKV